jgi:hypothetical protein
MDLSSLFASRGVGARAGLGCLVVFLVGVVAVGVWGVAAPDSEYASAALTSAPGIGAALLALLTYLYVLLTHGILEAQHLTLEEQQRAQVVDRATARAEELRAGVAMAFGAANDASTAASKVAVLRSRRMLWRPRAIDPLHDAVSRVATACDRIRLVVRLESVPVVDGFFDVVLEMHGAAVSGDESEFQRCAERLADRRGDLRREADVLATGWLDDASAGPIR